jgi:hypothetical protein
MHGTLPKVRTGAIRARCRLKQAKTLFLDRAWPQLPQTERGRRILRWGADHAWLAGPDNPQRSVRRWCRHWAPWLSPGELDAIVAATATSNKRWNDDDCARVLLIGVRDRMRLNLRDLGADDDPRGEIRAELRRIRKAERSRRDREAKGSTGRKVGRPALELSPEAKRAHKNAKAAKRMRQYRALRKTPRQSLRVIGDVSELSVTRSAPPAGRKRPSNGVPSAPPCPAKPLPGIEERVRRALAVCDRAYADQFGERLFAERGPSQRRPAVAKQDGPETRPGARAPLESVNEEPQPRAAPMPVDTVLAYG